MSHHLKSIFLKGFKGRLREFKLGEFFLRKIPWWFLLRTNIMIQGLKWIWVFFHLLWHWHFRQLLETRVLEFLIFFGIDFHIEWLIFRLLFFEKLFDFILLSSSLWFFCCYFGSFVFEKDCKFLSNFFHGEWVIVDELHYIWLYDCRHKWYWYIKDGIDCISRFHDYLHHLVHAFQTEFQLREFGLS